MIDLVPKKTQIISECKIQLQVLVDTKGIVTFFYGLDNLVFILIFFLVKFFKLAQKLAKKKKFDFSLENNPQKCARIYFRAINNVPLFELDVITFCSIVVQNVDH